MYTVYCTVFSMEKGQTVYSGLPICPKRRKKQFCSGLRKVTAWSHRGTPSLYLYAHNNCVCKIVLWKNQYSCKKKYTQGYIHRNYVSLCSKRTLKSLLTRRSILSSDKKFLSNFLSSCRSKNKTQIRFNDDI